MTYELCGSKKDLNYMELKKKFLYGSKCKFVSSKEQEGCVRICLRPPCACLSYVKPCARDEALCFKTQVNLLRLPSYGNIPTKMSRFEKY